jgi:hypothetical protein
VRVPAHQAKVITVVVAVIAAAAAAGLRLRAAAAAMLPEAMAVLVHRLQLPDQPLPEQAGVAG